MRCASSISGSPRALAALALSVLALLAMGKTARAGEAGAGASDRSRSAASVRAVPVPHGMRVIAADASADVSEVPARVEALTRAGFHVEIAVAPHTFFVRGHGSQTLPPGFVDVTAATPAGVANAGAPASSAAPTSSTPPLRQPLARSTSEEAIDPFGGRGDALPPLALSETHRALRSRASLPAASLEGLPYGAGWESTSELMVGSVAVPILFPESDGSVDPDRFDWTPALRDSVVRSAVRGLLRWTSLASARGVPLTFVIEVHPPSPTRYEPIDRPVAQEFGWIEDTLEPFVGYQGDGALMAYDFANAARARLGTQWAALIFGVQNNTDVDGAFPDGFIAHAQLGGPWYVVPVNNLNTAANLDFYMEHEMAHMFWALDEFPANNAWWSCTYLTGYFNQPNWNSAVPIVSYCGWDDRCVMKGNYPDSLCALTRRQVGWHDGNQNSILDLYETRPAVVPDSTLYRVASGGTMLVRGTASDVAIPNQNPFLFGEGDSITIATIDSVFYRMDGGLWISVPAADGAMDEGSERFAISLSAPPVGAHKMEFLAKNSSGLTGLVPDTMSVSVSGGSAPGPPTPGPARPYLTAAPTPSSGSIRIAMRAPGGSVATARIYDVAGREARAWSFVVPPSGTLEWEWDGRPARGGTRAAGVYFLSVEAGGTRRSLRLVLLR